MTNHHQDIQGRLIRNIFITKLKLQEENGITLLLHLKILIPKFEKGSEEMDAITKKWNEIGSVFIVASSVSS